MEFKRKYERCKEASESLDIRPNDLLLCQSCWTTEHSTNKKNMMFFMTQTWVSVCIYKNFHQDKLERGLGLNQCPQSQDLWKTRQITVLPNSQKPKSNTVNKNYENIDSNNLEEQTFLPSPSPFQT